MILEECYELSNGMKLPKLGFGTWFIDDDKAAVAVSKAIALGYRHIDTAEAYGNERGVGEGIRRSGLPREELFVTTKLAAECKSAETAKKAIEESLRKMDIGYLDLMVIHSPQPWAEWRSEKRYFEENKEVWKVLEEYQQDGWIKAIGVSNFLIDDLESLLSSCTVKPVVNQVLTHIGNTPLSLIDYCVGKGIQMVSYSPVGHGKILQDRTVTKIACRYGVSPARLCIRYCLQLGTAAIPKSSNPVHMKENTDVGFTISDEDMEELKALKLEEPYGELSVFPVFSGK